MVVVVVVVVVVVAADDGEDDEFAAVSRSMAAAANKSMRVSLRVFGVVKPLLLVLLVLVLFEE